MTSWREFIEDADGRGSAARLNMVIGVLIGSITVLWFTFNNNLGGEVFATYMACTGGIYGFSKWRESVTDVAQIKADSPNQPADPAPQAPATVINVGADKTVKDANITAQGAVNVTAKPKRSKR